MTFPTRRAIVDCVACSGSMNDALSILTSCGLGEAPLWLRPFGTLSDGQRFRARLARAIGLYAGARNLRPILCDEFCTQLHRRSARSISYNLRNIVSRRGLCLVVACCDEDLIADLQPDSIVRLSGGGACTVEEQTVRSRAQFGLRRRLRIEAGRKADYEAFSAMHYRATDELGFVDKVFVLRDGAGGDLLGIVV
jgi:ABC-type glutathione transport system ATPase component